MRDVPLPFVVIALIILTALASGCCGEPRRAAMAAADPRDDPSRGHVTVVIVVPARSDWQTFVCHLRARAAYPKAVRACILVECSRPEDVFDDGADMGPNVRVEHVRTSRAKDRSSSARDREAVVQRFVCEDAADEIVAVVDPRVRLVYGWDVQLAALDLRRGLLTAPLPSARHGRACFPTVAAGGRRGRSAPFAANVPPGATTPGACICDEFVAGTWAEWERRSRHDPSDRIVCPTTPLTEADDALERAMVASSAPDALPAQAVCAERRVGLSRGSGDRERIYKFGSVHAARMAVEFARDGDAALGAR